VTNVDQGVQIDLTDAKEPVLSQDIVSRDSPSSLEEERPKFILGAPSIAAGVEALLLMADEPITVSEIAEICGTEAAEIEVTLLDLASQYEVQGRGFELREISAAWRFYTSTRCVDLVSRYVTDGRQAKLTQAALETLAIIAYRQPVSRAHVASVRGVNADGVIRTLLSRGLAAEVGEDPTTGAILFGTTSHFLDRMGLSSVSELPPIADHLPDLDTMEELLTA
jgi:segregation and condensation protein B